MNNVVSSYDRGFRGNVSFGHLSKDAKAVINRPEVRTILKKCYGIEKKDINQLDRSSLRFDLLSKSLPELQLPETAGLVMYERKANMPTICISEPHHNLRGAGPGFFAFSVNKAKQMEELYRTTMKDFSSHQVNKAWREEITKQERPIKIALKDFRDSYNSNNYGTMDKVAQKLKQSEEIELEIDEKYSKERKVVEGGLKSLVAKGWEVINNTPLPRNLQGGYEKPTIITLQKGENRNVRGFSLIKSEAV